MQQIVNEIDDANKTTTTSVKYSSINTFSYNIKKVALLSVIAFLLFGFKPVLLQYDGGKTGFRNKWFDGTTGKLYEDKTKTKEFKTFKIIANATDEVRSAGRVARGRNYWIVQLGSETFLFIVDPCGDEDCDETEETKNLKEGSGVVDMIYYIYVK